ncbi:MAG: ribosome small subunit-dependent GTPase A [Bacteroidales bacterium]|nr:ribosome small subunit-dependent GTPase A [Bacteroidales bacterium]
MENVKQRTAVVVKHTGSHYLLSELPAWAPFTAVVRGKLRMQDSRTTNPVAVGDRVVVEGEVIREVLPRTNCVVRKSTNLSRQSHVIAANVDVAVLVVTIAYPETKWPFIDRFLVTCEAYKVPVCIVLNKIDLYGETHRPLVDYFREVYEGAGYPVMETSAETGAGVEELRALCRDRVALFSGVSGVGKSSLIRALDPNLDLRVGEISSAHLQGKHTTTFYEMHPIASGGFLIDTPGIRGFGLVDVDKEEISTYFPEMLRVMDDCRFKPCTHTHDPGCAVKAAVDEGLIAGERYDAYLGMLEDEEKYR